MYPNSRFVHWKWWFAIAMLNYQRVLYGIAMAILYCQEFISGRYTDPSEKYESRLGWLLPIYGKVKKMFQATNQICIGLACHECNHRCSTNQSNQ